MLFHRYDLLLSYIWYLIITSKVLTEMMTDMRKASQLKKVMLAKQVGDYPANPIMFCLKL